MALLRFVKFGAAGRVGQDRMLHDVLVNGFDQRVVGNCLHEDGAVVVARRGGHIHLQGEAAILLQHLVMDVLNGFEPGHLRVMNMMRLVVEDGQFLDFADDLAEIRLAVGGLAGGLRAEWREKVITQVVVFQRRIGHVAKEDPVDVGQEQIAGVADDTHIVLDMQRELEIVPPVAALVSIAWQDRVIEENPEAVEVRPQAVEHDDVRRDDEEIARQRGVCFVQFVKEAPGDEEGEDFRFPGAGRHFHDIARPVFVEHAGRYCAGRIEAKQVIFLAGAADFEQPDDGLHCFTLGKIIAKGRERTVSVFDEMFTFEPVPEQRCRSGRRTGISFGSPGKDFLPHFGDEWREQLFVGRVAEHFVSRKPALLWNQRGVRRGWEIRVQRHSYLSLKRLRLAAGEYPFPQEKSPRPCGEACFVCPAFWSTYFASNQLRGPQFIHPPSEDKNFAHPFYRRARLRYNPRCSGANLWPLSLLNIRNASASWLN